MAALLAHVLTRRAFLGWAGLAAAPLAGSPKARCGLAPSLTLAPSESLAPSAGNRWCR